MGTRPLPRRPDGIACRGGLGILPLAAAPSERFVLGGLDPAKKALALAFHRRDERLLDFVLLDVRDAGGLAVALRRTPSAIVIAPPGGNFMALGTQARASLQDVLMDLAAPVVVGVGHPSLPASLAEIGIVPSPGRAVSSAPGLLCDPAFDSAGCSAMPSASSPPPAAALPRSGPPERAAPVTERHRSPGGTHCPRPPQAPRLIAGVAVDVCRFATAGPQGRKKVGAEKE